MSVQSLAPDAACWPFLFGKMPAHGDFISRGLDDETIEQGDATISEAMALASVRWDADWEDIYVETPVWRFVATPGVLGRFWLAGVFLPSVDAVGRQFPLMAGFASSTLTLLADTDATGEALDEVEAVARATLLEGHSIDAAMDLLAQAAKSLLSLPSSDDEALRAFAHRTLAALETAVWLPDSRWWVASGGDENRLDMKGPLSPEGIAGLFRRPPAPAAASPAEAPPPDPSDALLQQTEDKPAPIVVPSDDMSGEQMSEDKP